MYILYMNEETSGSARCCPWNFLTSNFEEKIKNGCPTENDKIIFKSANFTNFTVLSLGIIKNLRIQKS